MVDLLYHPRKHLTPADMLSHYTNQIRPRIKYSCPLWFHAVQSSLSKQFYKNAYSDLGIMNYYPPYDPYPTNETSLASRKSIEISMADV